MPGRFRATAETTTPAKPPGYAGEAYLALILELLAEETRTRESLERRAVGVLATMAVIVTVIATLASGQALDEVSAGRWATFLAMGAGVMLLFAGTFAWRTVLPRRYKVADRAKLRTIAENPVFWNADHRIGTRRSAESLLDSLDSARTANGHKAWTLVASMGLGLIGVALLAGAAISFVSGA